MSPVLPLVFALTNALSPSTGEKSGFVRTGRYDEAARTCREIAHDEPKRARCVGFGTTPEGREMLALVLSDDGVLDADTARAKQRPVLYAQGGIHAGEIDGKDAGFLVVKELLAGTLAKGVLSQVTFVFVPVFNIDGHERMSKNNRPNQRGPEEMGWRTTAQNYNLNRDYMKAESPEMHAMLALLNAWDPVLSIDLHVTDGAQFRHDVSVIIDPSLYGPPALRDEASAFTARLMKVLASKEGGAHLPVDFYPSFEKDDDPASGFARGVAPPRFSQPYWALHNRMGMLVETHSWRPYAYRVRTTRDVLAAIFVDAREHLAAWVRAERELDRDVGERLSDVVLTYKNTDAKTTIDFLGYAYERSLSPVSGGLRIRYDEKKPAVWKVPLVTGVEADVTVKPPGAGYVIPAAHAALIREKLRTHGVRFIEVNEARVADVEVFRASDTKFGDKPYEGRQQLTVKGAWTREKRDVQKGALFVPIKQPLARLAVHLFEPLAPDSFLKWGFFNACFEQKEYMEAYVAEDVALEMLRDPKVRATFEEKLASDPAFAASPQARLDFFYARHPSFDERMNLYPVMRVDTWRE